MVRLSAVLLVLSAMICGLASAQTFNFAADREPIISLDGQWRFHTGDDPHWADPQFDDSHWALLRSDRDWAQQGHKGYNGMAWYRFRVKGFPKDRLGILLPGLLTSYQVFANGRRIGTFGEMPPNAVPYYPKAAFFDIAGPLPDDLSIAIRVWHSPLLSSYYGGGPRNGDGLLGSAELVRRYHQLALYRTVWSVNNDVLLGTLYLLATLAALILFGLRATEFEYLWFACFALLSTGERALSIYGRLNPMPILTHDLIFNPLRNGIVVTIILFYSRILNTRRSLWFWVAILAALSTEIVSVFVNNGLINYIPASSFGVGMFLVSSSWLVGVTWHGVQEKVQDAKLLIWPALFWSLGSLWTWTASILFMAGVSPPFRGAYQFILFPITVYDVTGILFQLAAIGILVGRFARTKRGEEEYARELEAARAVQKILVPELTPSVPGFQIASVYEPAKEVGGDFFQIIPQENGVLLAIGDVSGKGLPAAMTVSLIVGALRMVVEQTSSPAAILEGLNRRLVGRGSGFTTCLVLAMHTDGTGRIANAGHLAPYRNGSEMEFSAHLPLGLSMETQYAETMLSLREGDRLTFLSDGVVEARNKDGELFGFDRTRLSSTKQAEEIVTAAQLFGQEDDITVLTMQYLGTATA